MPDRRPSCRTRSGGSQAASIHGWIYHINDGIFQGLQVTLDSLEDLNRLGIKMIERQPGKIKTVSLSAK